MSDIVKRCREAAHCIYIAVGEPAARDIAKRFTDAANRIEELERLVEDLKSEVEAADGARREEGYRCD